MFKPEIGTLLLAKRSWEICYNDSAVSITFQPVSGSSHSPARRISPVKRPVARALCFDDLSEPVTEAFEFTAVPKVTMKRDRKSRTSKILVDTEVRRSARFSALRDGFRKIPSSDPSPHRRSHTMKKRKTKPAQSDESPSVPPPTAIADLQRIGARLRIAPAKITVDKPVADPAKSNSSNSSDD